MALQSSLRQKKRYILFKILSEKTFSFPEVKAAVEDGLQLFLGQWGVAKAAPLLVKEKHQPPFFTLKVNHTFVDEVKSAVILIKSIKNTPVILRSLRISGGLRKLSEVSYESKTND